jgi:hypothetical protein
MTPLARTTCCAILLFIGFCVGAAHAQNSAPASDNPSAGLSLGDSDSLTGFAAKFNHHLVILDDGNLKPFDAAALKNVKYFAFLPAGPSHRSWSIFTSRSRRSIPISS